MNKKTTLLLICLLGCASLFAQQKTYKVDYSFFVSDEIKNINLDSETDQDKRDLAMIALIASMFAEEGKPIIQLWTNDDFLRIETQGPMENNIQITNKTTGESYTLYPDQEEYMVTPEISDKILNMGEELQLASELPLKFIANETKVIAGKTCKLAQIEFGAEVGHINVWYSEEVPTAYWGDYPYLKELPGAALEVISQGVGIQALSVTESTDADLFVIPEHYSLIESFGDDSEWSSSTDLGNDRYIYIDEETELMGIVDGEDKLLTPVKYTLISPFEDNYSVAISEDHLFGVLNIHGEEIIPFQYPYLKYEAESKIFQFEENELYGLMDPNGKVIAPAKYNYLRTFSADKVIFLEDEKYGILDASGKEIVPATHEVILEIFDNQFIAMNENDEFAFYSIADNKQTSEYYDFLESAGTEGLFRAIKNERHGFINAKGQVIIPFRFDSVTRFEGDKAEVFDPDTNEFYWINTKGERIDAPE